MHGPELIIVYKVQGIVSCSSPQNTKKVCSILCLILPTKGTKKVYLVIEKWEQNDPLGLVYWLYWICDNALKSEIVSSRANARAIKSKKKKKKLNRCTVRSQQVKQKCKKNTEIFPNFEEGQKKDD